MRASIIASLLGSAVLATGCGGGHLLPVPPAYRKGFTGTWVLNRDMTTTLRGGQDAERGRMGGRGVLGRGGFGGRGRFGGRGDDGDEGREGGEGREAPGGGRAGGNFDRVAMRDLMRMAGPSPQLDITLEDSTITIEAGRQADERITARLDDKDVEIELPDQQKLKTKARFDGKNDVIVVERTVSKGGTVEQKFTLTPRDDRIIVEVSVRGGSRGTRTMRQVYDRQGTS